MTNPALDYAIWSILNEDNVPILCSRKEANAWWNREYVSCNIQSGRIDGWGIETAFRRYSLAPDGPPLFFRVCFWKWIETSCTMAQGERFFGTMAAIHFHAELVAKGGEDLMSLADHQDGEDRDDDDGEPRDAANWWKDR
jgi:hypothetical protein